MAQFLVKTDFVDKTLPVVRVELGGYIDQSNSDKVQKVFDNLFMSGHFNVIFDFSPLIYMSSAGWGVFVGEVKRFRENGGDIKLVNMNAEIYEIFQMLEFYHIMEDYNSMPEALSAFGVEIKTEPNGKIEKREKQAETPPSPPPPKPAPESSSFFEQSKKLFESEEPRNETVPWTPEIKKVPQVEKTITRDNNHRDKKRRSSELDLAILPVQEKIRKIVARFPLISIRKMKRMLKHEDFGRERVNYFRLYRILKELNLESKPKRYRYYRSC
jgi:anti-sigma B factor antagonist